MENRKVSNLRCFAIAIAIAIASVFTCKNAFATSSVIWSKNADAQFTNGWEVDNSISFSTGSPKQGINWLRVKNGQSWELPAKNGDDIQVIFNIFPNSLTSSSNFRVVNLDNSVNDNAKLTDVDYSLLTQNGGTFSWTCGSSSCSDANYGSLNFRNGSSSLLKLKYRAIKDNPQLIIGSSSNLFFQNQPLNLEPEGFTIQLLAINIITNDEVDHKTVNENQQAEKQGRENINNQDKSGDDYGTGNKQESLLNAIKRFGEALTYKKGNCSAKIPAWGKISSGMTLDLCNTGVAMTGLSVILSVVAIFFFIPLAKSWLDTIIGLIREMQG